MSEKPSASEESAQRLLGGRAWEDYCDVLKLAGAPLSALATNQLRWTARRVVPLPHAPDA
jgi:hypothetical protein